MARRDDDEIGRAPKKRAGAYRRSAEVKGRAIPAQAGPRSRTLAEVLASMPDVGVDAGFGRIGSVDLSAAPFSESGRPAAPPPAPRPTSPQRGEGTAAPPPPLPLWERVGGRATQ